MASVAAFAGSVPANYDKYLGPVLFEPYALDIIERLHNPKNVLEIACGTGRVTKHLVGKLPSDGTLTATDINGDMIAIAKDVVKDERVEWQVADAQQLPFENNSFDHIICQYGVMFFPDKQQAMKEAYRVLQPGGKYIFNVWDELSTNPRSMIIKTTMEEIMGSDAPDFLSKGPYSWFDRAEIRKVVEAAGFKNVTMEVVQKTGTYDKVEYLLNGFVHGSPLASYLANQTEELKNEIVSRMKAKMTAELGETNVPSPMQALVWTMEK